MKGKFGVAALLLSSIAFAGPVSTPNNVNDTPIISGGGSVSGGGICKAYQTDGTAVNLSGGETLVFYGGGWIRNGGYLSTKTTYSGPAYVKLSKHCWWSGLQGYLCTTYGYAIGLFARNTDAQQDFIAGAGGGYSGWVDLVTVCSPASGGGWHGEPSSCTDRASLYVYNLEGGSVYWGNWFHTYWYDNKPSAGFFGSFGGGGASSISAWYNYYTKDYTSPPTSATITGGGIVGQGRLYVCQ